MITEINNAWNWKGIKATEIIRTNEFGNVIFKTDKKKTPDFFIRKNRNTAHFSRSIYK